MTDLPSPYDLRELCLRATETGVETYYAADGSGVIAEFQTLTSSSWQWKKNYIKWGDRLVATETSDGLQYQHPDRLGTKLITNASGSVISEQAHLPFGTSLPTTSTFGIGEASQSSSQPNPHQRRFTSYERSATTNLDYAVNRQYAAEQGRFTQVDPIGMAAVSLENPQTLNLYAYCANDPVNHTDPSGLLPKWLKRLLQIAMIAVSIFAAVTSVLAVFSAFSKAIQLSHFFSAAFGVKTTATGVIKWAVYILGKNSIFHGLMALTQNAISIASNVASIFGKKLPSGLSFAGTIAGFLSSPLIVTKNITDARGVKKTVTDVGKTFDKWFNMATGTASQIASWAEAKQAGAVIGLVSIFSTLKSSWKALKNLKTIAVNSPYIEDWEFARVGFSKEKHFWGFKTYEAWKYNAGGFNKQVLLMVIEVNYYVFSYGRSYRAEGIATRTWLALLLGLSIYEQGLSINDKKNKAEKAFQ
jgi:RHS repeat-associated protein